MDFIQLQSWANGDAEQGKWMLSFSVLLVLLFILVLRSENTLLRGMMIPIFLLLVLNTCYGTYLVMNRIRYAAEINQKFKKDAQKTVAAEYRKTKNDEKSYTVFRIVWAMLTIISLILCFIFTADYYRGLSLGFTGLFFGLLCIDTFLHYRISLYFADLQSLLS
ncbi:hypothetical protein [Chryseobacterium sp. BIGb0232]|uniref:hypothetical protein n=1 Tax=Chryseobacterium sp. BIGb0232 TaxID=2940598 RepID=UPI000F473CFC|nr:hypothetical protein [Chryseobacterium sp. BIGb0232]MCS4304918.1 ABC-type multidrug transport system permease subunit [Chryseobacterium sp. BIGb0232]ROS09662.1 hypothetical protein EDF65_4401 [Chryseobacterium nakagawai]